MKILILGIGNVMFGDEGLGVHFINLISQNFNFKSSLAEHIADLTALYDRAPAAADR